MAALPRATPSVMRSRSGPGSCSNTTSSLSAIQAPPGADSHPAAQRFGVPQPFGPVIGDKDPPDRARSERPLLPG
jgi:hypothetical protein